jgi:hypothetical protein
MPVRTPNCRSGRKVNHPEEMSTPKKMDESMETPKTPTTPTPIDTPPIIDSKRECQYLVIVTVPPFTKPWKAFTDLSKRGKKSSLVDYELLE